MKPFSHDSLSPELGIQQAPQTLYGLPQLHDKDPGNILRRNHGRDPLRCDVGEVRNNLGAAQDAAAARGPRI